MGKAGQPGPLSWEPESLGLRAGGRGERRGYRERLSPEADEPWGLTGPGPDLPRPLGPVGSWNVLENAYLDYGDAGVLQPLFTRRLSSKSWPAKGMGCFGGGMSLFLGNWMGGI